MLNRVSVKHAYKDEYRAINALDGNLIFRKRCPKKPDNFWDQFATIDWNHVDGRDDDELDLEEKSDDEGSEIVMNLLNLNLELITKHYLRSKIGSLMKAVGN